MFIKMKAEEEMQSDLYKYVQNILSKYMVSKYYGCTTKKHRRHKI